MILSSKAYARWSANSTGRWATLGAIAVLALVASCGGSTSQIDPFVPARLLVFGDENSLLTPDGRRFGVNGLAENGNIDCTKNPVWVQALATFFQFSFAECNPTFESEPKARMLAFVGAKVADVTAQVEAQVAAGGFRDKDLAAVMIGVNDIFELYDQYPSLTEASLIAEAQARGERAARAVNRLVGLGVKVVVSDLPDLGLTPFAFSQRALGGSFDRAALISRLTTAFNERLGVNVLLDGRFVGLVQAQLRMQTINRSPGSFGFTNIIDAACTVALPTCTTVTQVPEAQTGSFLWSDDKHLAPSGHDQLATLAIDRVRRNPF